MLTGREDTSTPHSPCRDGGGASDPSGDSKLISVLVRPGCAEEQADQGVAGEAGAS